MTKIDIKNFTFVELKTQLAGLQQAAYRAEQIYFWLYQRGALGFDDMRNMSKPLLKTLEEKFYISTLELCEHQSSPQQAEKFLFKLADDNFIETVLITAKERKTVCLSTQVGCKFGCAFCASGRNGFVRDLTPGEIVNQALCLHYTLQHRITNYVFMGMGEPLDNLDNLIKAITIMNEPKGLAVGARRITVSTCGIIPGIEKLKDLNLQINLSISLHAVNNALRDELVPINKKYPLEKLIKACEKYVAFGGRIITLEYVLIKNKNDSAKDADKLAAIAKKIRAKVNIIPCSPIDSSGYQPPQEREINAFIERLTSTGVSATVRESKGADIQAACGQLAGRKKV
ncbi:MAG: 23S rRNA (adenine(2503)-C(2))-methyltransferase RlmN [Candidatus Omnitrophota bacterium]